jgi:SAM-dependent methyltransferase
MTDGEAGRFWDRNAHAWTKLSRAGYDVYRDVVNTPAFLEMLPPVEGLRGLDIGCGEGHNTRLLEQLGARMSAIDISPAFVQSAAEVARSQVKYAVGSAQALPFRSESFDFCTAFMSLMDVPDQLKALGEAHRALRSGGFLQFSILHPCFNTPHRRLLRNERGEAYAVELGRYFDRTEGDIERWLFSAAPAEAKKGLPPFEIPLFHRTISEWLNDIRDAGFQVEEVREPFADAETARRYPQVADTRVVSYFLHVRCRKA